jgi:hypothetical protein
MASAVKQAEQFEMLEHRMTRITVVAARLSCGFTGSSVLWLAREFFAGQGVLPDLWVEAFPDAVQKGRDHQLEKAIEVGRVLINPQPATGSPPDPPRRR